MKTFKEFLYEQKTPMVSESRILVLATMLAQDDLMLEGPIEESMNDILKKFGLEVKKEGPGLIDYIKSFTTNAGKLILAAIKGDKKKVKEIASKLDRETVMDFLLKLDMATLHIITGPIHTIDAITGWELWAAIEDKARQAKSIFDEIKEMIIKLKKKIEIAFDDKVKKPLEQELARLEGMLPITA